MRLVSLFFLFVLIAVSASAEPIVVKNSAQPANGVVKLQLEEQWRVGGPDDEETFFGQITWAETDAEGLLYVLDAQLCEVSVYDRDGTRVKSLFREGDGPGEVRQPRDLVVFPDGTIGVVQEFPGKIIRVDGDGNPVSSIIPNTGDPTDGGMIGLISAEHRGGTFITTGTAIKPGAHQGLRDRNMYLSTIDSEGVRIKQLLNQTTTWDFTNFVYDEEKSLPSFWWASTVGPEGKVYAAPDRNAYRINIYATDGTLERVVEREYKSWKRTADDRAWITALLTGAFRSVPFEVNLKISDIERDISWLTRSLQVDDDGNIWVLSSRGTREQPVGVMATFDVFDKAGRFDRQVQVICPEGDASEDGIFLLGNDRVLLIKGYVDAAAASFGGSGIEDDGEAEPMELVCYGVKR